MLFSYDLTGERFEHLDFCESLLSLPFFEEFTLSQTLEIAVWGATFYPNEFPIDPRLVPADFDERRSAGMFLQNWAVLEFQEVIGFVLEVKPYAPRLDYRGEFIKRGEEFLSLRHSLGDLQRDAPSYCFESAIEHPYGDLQLEIKAAGIVRIQADSEGFTPDSRRSPDRHWSDRRRQVLGTSAQPRSIREG